MDLLAMAYGIEEDIRAWRRHIHQNPELSGEEQETAWYVAEALKKIGAEDIRIIDETGVTALIRGDRGGKTLALRADMDALPGTEASGLPFSSQKEGKAHMCGHDIHTAVLLGATTLLTSLREHFAGTVRLIFQPSEEKLAGAKLMIAGGVLENPIPDCVAALHVWPELPAGTVGVRYGAATAASDSIIVEFTGSQGHAAHPHKCIDPILMAGQFVANVQAIVSREISPVDSAVLTFGSIHGGTVGNIIPETVTLKGTIRTLLPETRELVAEAAKRYAEATAAASRGKVSVQIHQGVPSLFSHPDFIALFEKGAKDLLGSDKVVTLPNPSMGGEDFAFYVEKIPGLFFRLGVGRAGEPNAPLHSPAFIADESALPVGAAAFVRFALDFLAEEV